MRADGSLPLPHGGPALLIEDVLEVDREGATCLARVPSGSPFRHEDGARSVVPAYLAIEMGAQAAALCEGGEQGGQEGAIVSVRETRCHASSLDADVIYTVRVTLVECIPPLRYYRFEASLHDEVLVEGVVGTYLAAED